MSTHNIGLYEEIRKVITQFSSNIIKYAPYFFCCPTTDETICSYSLFFHNSFSAIRLHIYAGLMYGITIMGNIFKSYNTADNIMQLQFNLIITLSSGL